jgi:hypothetical protein
VIAGVAATASALGLASCTNSSSATTCQPATAAQEMATHGSLAVRTLRRDVATIVTRAEQQMDTQPTGDGSSRSIPPTLADDVALMATKVAELRYPPQYQSTAQAMVNQAQSLAASLRSGQVGAESGNALIAAVDASQQFYKALGIPSVCTTTTGS